MKIINKLLAICTLLFAFGMSSCNDDDNTTGGGFPSNLNTAFATFVSSGDNGSVFTVQKSADSPVATLTSTTKVSSDALKAGERVILQYVPTGSDAYASGPVTIYGIGKIINGKVSEATETEINGMRNDYLKMLIFDRTGAYINIWAEATLRNEPAKFTIVADKATLGDAYPKLYVVFETDSDMGSTRSVYASFDIASVFNQSTCEGVEVYYRTRGGYEKKRFDKALLVDPGTDPVE